MKRVARRHTVTPSINVKNNHAEIHSDPILNNEAFGFLKSVPNKNKKKNKKMSRDQLLNTMP